MNLLRSRSRETSGTGRRPKSRDCGYVPGLLVALFATLLSAESPDTYRRVLVPENQLPQFAKGHPRYLKLADFERLTREAGRSVPVRLDARLERAVYRARVVPGGLEGTAEWQIARDGDEPALVPLGGFGLALGTTQRHDAPANGERGNGEPGNGLANGGPTWTETPPRAAVLGLDDRGRTVLWADSSATVRVPWTLRHARSSEPGARFDLALATCSTNLFLLVAPNGHVPEVDHGRVVPLAAEQRAEWGDLVPTADEAAWRIELGGNDRFALRLVPPSGAPAATTPRTAPRAAARVAAEYTFTPRQVELLAKLTFDVHAGPLGHLVVELEPGLKPRSVRLGESDVPHTSTTLPDGRTRLLLEFPEPLSGAGREVQLAALATLRLGERWRVPQVRVPGTAWQQSRLTLRVREPLVLQQLLPQGAQPGRLTPNTVPAGDSVELVAHDPAATCDVWLDVRPTQMQVTTGTTVEFDEAALTARMAVALAASHGERFVAECRVPRFWRIDRVEAEAPAELEGTFQVTPLPPETQLLRVRLRTPVRPGQPVRLTVQMHGNPLPFRPSPTSPPVLPGGLLRVADFRQVESQRHVVAINAPTPLTPQFRGDRELPRVDPKSLPAAEAALLTARPNALALLADDRLAGVSVTLERDRPRFDAEIQVEAFAGRTSISERYRFECKPQTGAISRLRVRFSESRAEPPQWQLDGSPDNVTARKLAMEDPTTAGETWDVVLRQERAAPFVLEARRDGEAADDVSLALASLPRANSQTGLLRVVSIDAARVSVDGEALRPVPPAPAQERIDPVVGTFRFDPAHDTRVTLRRTDSAGDGPARVWIWDLVQTARLTPSGAESHSFRLHLENTGATELLLTPPDGFSVRSASIDGQQVFVTARAPAALVVPLPPGTRFPTLELTGDNTPAPRSGVHRVPVLRFAVPVLNAQLVLRTPPGYDVRARANTSGYLADRGSAPLSIGERLAGPFFEPNRRRPFRIFSTDDWHALWRGTAAQRRETPAFRLLAHLGRLSGSPNPSTWGDALAEFGGEIRIDPVALAARGVTAHTRLSGAFGRRDEDRGAALLERAGLSLVAAADALVLCRGPLAHPTRDDTSPTHVRGLPGFAGVVQTEANWQEVDPHGRAATELADVRTWQSLPALPVRPWPRREGVGALVDTGWHRREIPWNDVAAAGGYVEFVGVRTAAEWSAGWAAALMAAGVVWWWARRRPFAIAAVAAGGAALALVANPALVPVFRGVCHGALLGGLAWWSFRPRPQPVRAPAIGSSIRRLATATGVVAGGWIALVSIATWCRDVRSDESRATATPQTVLVPVNDRREPGPYVYLSETFYERLQARGRSVPFDASSWVLRSARYRASFDWEAIGMSLSPSQLDVAFEFEAFAGDARVELPWPRRKLSLLPGGVRLNGQPIQADWQPDAERLAFDVGQAGRHTLEVSVRPAVDVQGPLASFDVVVPPVPQSQVQVMLPVGVRGVQVDGARGTMRSSPTGETTVGLGPIDRLRLTWPADVRLPPDASRAMVDQLTWLRITPRSVTMDVRLKVSSAGGAPERLELSIDPRLRLLPPRADQPVERIDTSSDGRHVSIVLKKDAPAEFTLQTGFVLTGVLGVGRVGVPLAALAPRPPGRRWLAVSFDTALDGKPDGAWSAPAVAPASFLAAWGEPTEASQLAYELTAGEREWSFAAQPKRAVAAADVQLDLSVGTTSVLAAYAFELDSVPNPQVVVRAAKQLEVVDVAVWQEKANHVVRWHADTNGLVTLFLAKRLTGAARLELTGRLPIAAGSATASKKTTVPPLTVDDVEPRSTTVRIYRRSEVHVDVPRPSQWDEPAPAEPAPAATGPEAHRVGWGRLVRTLTNAAPAKKPGPIVLDVRTNTPEVAAELTTSLQRTNDWQASLHVTVQVTRGALDGFRFEVPNTWAGPYLCDPRAEVQVTPIVGRDRSVVLVRPEQPIRDTWELRLSGSLLTLPGKPLAVPDIVPLDFDRTTSYVELPTEERQRRITWNTTSLELATAAKESPPEPTTADGDPSLVRRAVARYRVTDRRFEARLEPVEVSEGVPQVRLADIRIAERPDRSYVGLAVFDLEPNGRTACELDLAPGQKLLHVAVSGVPAEVRSASASRWRVKLRSDRWPQRIELLFFGRSEPSAAMAWRAPRLGTFPVTRTLWTVYAPSPAAFDVPGAGIPGSGVSARRQQEIRWQSQTEVEQQLADELADPSAEELQTWHAHWSRQMVLTRLGLAYEQAHARPPREPGTAEDSSWADPELVRQAPKTLTDAAHLWATLCAGDAAVHSMHVGAAPERPRTDPPVRRGSGAGRWLLALSLLALTALGRRLPFQRLAPDRSLPLACVVCGLAWWLFLSPSALGWFGLLVGLVGWHRRA